ncbi:unnamed protein product [Adineta steineri]|uniref:Uncharacterized protein n=1 Tax=Adineta steineri TaxID=433720 RepID=A0A819MCJ8_9BILA|nr:unnamed protein product [Adineta steineri]CAF3977439.1 unnamed protein product [Adineta steineri]
MSTSHLTVHDLSKDGNSAKIIYSKPLDYTIQSTEPINCSDTNTQVHQPQSTYNIDSTSPLINPNQKT